MNITLAATPQVIGDQQYPVGIMQVDGATVSTCICTAGLIHVLERKIRLLFLRALPTETKQARDEIAWLQNFLFSQRISPTVSKLGILDVVCTLLKTRYVTPACLNFTNFI